MRQKLIVILVFITMASLLTGCMSTGSFLAQNVTEVDVVNPKAKIVARNVEGHSEAGYILGMSYSTGFMANTFALARVSGSAKMYDDAIRDIWKTYEEENGEIEGKKLVLTNIRFDNDILNLIVYTKTDLYLHADIMEIVE